jgi:hypothetical protein
MVNGITPFFGRNRKVRRATAPVTNYPSGNQEVKSLAKPCVLSSETRSDANRKQNDPNNRRRRIFFISTEINSYDVFCSTSHVVAK